MKFILIFMSVLLLISCTKTKTSYIYKSNYKTQQEYYKDLSGCEVASNSVGLRYNPTVNVYNSYNSNSGGLSNALTEYTKLMNKQSNLRLEQLQLERMQIEKTLLKNNCMRGKGWNIVKQTYKVNRFTGEKVIDAKKFHK
ncbi:hypothetical protein [uncultured Gammaproteobacteria bacterium]|jgi:hypothetical protein|uniref:hypothetical protein n=1 Tax=thiotrophic endosymbiont of Bathymodiolus puteoserpentis (Logatchev) TaxID=343240 RepID=UPI0010B74429|nr:hypothetical protein [thiotrophic endosymbiont of Bathymodiolus puteoserpentis (Logatchev)]CAC9488988.1 hypothetical protein [uncultured Gammaproteobacteria bacterium]CAC9490933.1 hypothetical protein [uncultured Gammaproteobacteria bacterium]CAC9582835.1 hypothetical protein [uncultured Gammaproteobacteria bacterium]CAC9629069.1 hypothetical protein [uncultured Gammaproteobacteria bacterium]CAC9995943.1 hypothetical protein [uncultured Gammaproteobacteria bacterium]